MARAGWGRWLGGGYYVALAALLYLPIGLLVAFSFNDSIVLALPLRGFTLEWYRQLAGARELLESVGNSLKVGLAGSLASLALGTMAAIAIMRFQFRGRDAFLSLASLPLVVPYVVLAVALLILFNALGVRLSLWTVAVGHVIINVPYVMLIVAARLAGFQANLEEAAMDLGASYWGTLTRVTLPLSAPALAAAFLSSFTTSFDEFTLAFFLTGTENTLPVYLYSQLRFPSRLPLVVALAAAVMAVSILVLALSEWLRRVGEGYQSSRGKE